MLLLCVLFVRFVSLFVCSVSFGVCLLCVSCVCYDVYWLLVCLFVALCLFMCKVFVVVLFGCLCVLCVFSLVVCVCLARLCV